MEERSAGILLHPTSLPGPHGIGDLGQAAHRFVDWLADCGLSRWQVLPLVPPGPGHSPYSSYSALSLSPWIIDLGGLREDGLLEDDDLVPPGFPADRIDFKAMTWFKEPRLRKAADRLAQDEAHPLHEEFAGFGTDHPWAAEAALFAALHRKHAQAPWWDWPDGLRDRVPATLAAGREELAGDIAIELALQFLVERQWSALRAHAATRAVRIIGDLPIYVDLDSVDVWAHREQFQLDEKGRPEVVAGVPPDYFSQTGQLWGNPIYHWDRMKADAHSWWVARMGRALALFDIVRLDHFRGFAAYWSVPAGAEDARPGEWVDGPGRALFDDLRAALGELPLIAEDLGQIDAAVHALRNELELPGMKVIQFAFHGGDSHPFLPHSHQPNCVVYPGTHDNDTTLGWLQSESEAARERIRNYFGAPPGTGEHELLWTVLRWAFASVAHTVIVPMQDALGLGSEARMNVPGEADGNWGWRLVSEIDHRAEERIRNFSRIYGRMPPALPDPEL